MSAHLTNQTARDWRTLHKLHQRRQGMSCSIVGIRRVSESKRSPLMFTLQRSVGECENQANVTAARRSSINGESAIAWFDNRAGDHHTAPILCDVLATTQPPYAMFRV